MDNFDVFCVQFVVQSIERISSDPQCAVIENIMLKFGEQTVYIYQKPIIFEEKQKYASIKKGKICFCEKEQLGFEIIVKLQKGYASNQVSFISFEDKKNRSTLQASIPLRNAFHKTLFNINFISSRHLLKNLGRQIETESIGIQATPRLRNSHAQTSTISQSNVAIQTSKKKQKNVWTLKTVETKEISTQTELTKTVSIVEERKALMRLIVLLVCKLSTRINGGGSRIRPVEQPKPKVVEEIPPEPVDLHAAQQFSNLRKKQIEQMRERLHQMAEERKEILELTNTKVDAGKKTAVIAKSTSQQGSKKPDITAFLEPASAPKVVSKPTPAPVPSLPAAAPSTTYVAPANPSFEFSTDKERVIISSDIPSLTSLQQQQSIPSEPRSTTPAPPTPTTLEPHRSSPFSRQESILSSIHSQQVSEGELDELPSPLQSVAQSPVPPPPLRRKSYTLAETSQDSIKSVTSNFLEPSFFVPPPQPQRPRHVEIREPEVSRIPSPRKASPKKEIEKSESSSATASSEDTTESSSSAASESSQTSEEASSDESSSASSTAESSSSTASDSTLKKKKSSSSSSTLGEGSISTEDSIQEDIPEAIDSDVQSVKNASSISEASFSRNSGKLSPASKYLSNAGKTKRKSFAKKTVNSDSVSSYAPSDFE